MDTHEFECDQHSVHAAKKYRKKSPLVLCIMGQTSDESHSMKCSYPQVQGEAVRAVFVVRN